MLAAGGAIAASGDCTLAQIIPDGTLGAEGSIVTPTNINGLPTNQIDGGATRGANLFHSFEQLSVPTGGAAYFNNALNIQNIISRVTGSSVSNIDGLLRANGTANLFLLNPNGIIFGPNASLDIGGSFLASTASRLNFGDGTFFSATTPQTTPLLTVNVPIGLQYGGTARDIQVQGTVLQVQNGQTLALVGGDVNVEGGEFGFLHAPGGRVELGGLSGAGVVEIEGQQSDGTFGLTALRFPDLVERADVLLTNSAYVNVAAEGGGSIAINARNLKVLGGVFGGSQLRAGIRAGSGSAGSQAGDIMLNATGEITVGQSSRIENNVNPDATGHGGDINIQAGSLSITDDAQLIASTSGQGDAGSVTITAHDTVSFDEGKTFSSVEAGAVGKGGAVNITTGFLSVKNGAQLVATTWGQGDAGSVNINARETVSFDGKSAAFGTVESRAMGHGGDINIKTGSLSVTDGAQLAASTKGQGDAGSVNINARDTVSFDGDSAALSAVESGGVGNGSSINITTGSLEVKNGAQLLALTRGRGGAGSVNINARETVSFDGVSSKGFSSAASSAVLSTAEGNGGSVKITARSLFVTNGAGLTAYTFGRGNGGSVMINTRETVSFNGVGSNGFPSAAFSNASSTAAGSSGSINITTESLSLTNGAGLTASSRGSGAAGNIEVEASSIRLNSEAFLSSDTTGGQGNIILNSEDLVLRRGSNITTNATGTATGGNITIDTGVIAALEDSDITANAEEARGGQVIIDAQGLFGTEFRNQPTPLSDVTATGGSPDLSGTVEINTPDVDPSQGLVELPAKLVDASRLIASGCEAGGRQGENKFIITGRGGLPLRPGDAHTSYYPTGTVRSIPSSSPSIEPTIFVKDSVPVSNPTRVTAPAPLVEAQGWVINGKGEVVLTADASNNTPHSPWMTPATCNGSAISNQQPLALSTP